MTAGFSAGRADYDLQIGSRAMALRDALARVKDFKAHLDTRSDAFFLGLAVPAGLVAYTQADIDQFKSAYADMDQLRTIYEGTANLSVAKDFRQFAKLLTGVL